MFRLAISILIPILKIVLLRRLNHCFLLSLPWISEYMKIGRRKDRRRNSVLEMLVIIYDVNKLQICCLGEKHQDGVVFSEGT
jgi:hypothetical protein